MRISGWGKKVKQGTTLLLAGLMMVSAVDVPVLEVNAAEKKEYEITASGELDEDISYQQLSVDDAAAAGAAGAVGENGVNEENGDVNAGNGAENSGESGSVAEGQENEDENDANLQAVEEAENGIALFSTGQTGDFTYISGVESYDENGMPAKYKEESATCTVLTSASFSSSLTSGWYAVTENINSQDSLMINGTVNLILCDRGSLDINNSIEMSDGSVLNVYASENEQSSLKVYANEKDAFQGTNAAICIYGGNLDVYSSNKVLQDGVSLSGAPQMGRRFTDGNGNVITDWKNFSGLNIKEAKCDHKLSDLKYEASSVKGHENTYHQGKCPDCGYQAAGGDDIRCFKPDESNESAGHTTTCVCGHKLSDTESIEKHTFDDDHTCTICGFECKHDGDWTDGKCDVCGFECKHEDADVIDGKCTVCGIVFAAQNTTTGKKYQYLDDAMNEASDGDTVIMLTDSAMRNGVDVYRKTITLDLNGKNCTYGFIYIGNDDPGDECGGGLNLTGKGNHARIVMRPDDNNGVAFDGGSFGTIEFMTPWKNTTSTKAGSLLAAGYAFKNEDGTLVPYDYTLELYGNKLYNVTVVKCSAHQDKDNNGFCDYCNTTASSFVVSVTTEDGEVHYFTTEEGGLGPVIPDAVAYANEHNGTIRQINPWPYPIIIYDANCKVDLNNYRIACITAGGPNLTVTGDGTHSEVCCRMAMDLRRHLMIHGSQKKN